MLPPKMQSRPRTQPERPWMSEPALLVDRRAHQPSGSVNLAKSRSRERRQLRRLGPSRPVTQSLWPPRTHRRLSDLQQINQSVGLLCNLPKAESWQLGCRVWVKKAEVAQMSDLSPLRAAKRKLIKGHANPAKPTLKLFAATISGTNVSRWF